MAKSRQKQPAPKPSARKRRRARAAAKAAADRGPKEGTARALVRDRRLARIAELIPVAPSSAAIVRAIVDEFGIVERTAYLDLAEVYESCRPANEEDQKERIERGRRRWYSRRDYLQSTARELYAKGEYKAAAAYEGHANYAADRCSKIDGVYAPKKIDVDVAVAVDVRVAVRQVGDAFAEAPPEVIAALETVKTYLAARGLGTAAPRALAAGPPS